MKYNHMVNYNGQYYPAGTEVPVDDQAGAAQDIPFANEQEMADGQVAYTRTSISRMSTAELQQLAANVGIENALEKSGNELKKELVAYFNL